MTRIRECNLPVSAKKYKSEAQKLINDGIIKLAEKACREHGGAAQISKHYGMYDSRKYKVVLVENSS